MDQFESLQSAWTNANTADQDCEKRIENLLFSCDVSVENAPLFYRESTYVQILLYLSTVASRFPSARLSYITFAIQGSARVLHVARNRRTAFSTPSLIMTNKLHRNNCIILKENAGNSDLRQTGVAVNTALPGLGDSDGELPDEAVY